MSFDTTACGKRVRQLRRQHNLTQLALCEKLSISETYLRKIESGERSASIDLYIEIAEFFQVSLDYLILGTDQCINQSTRSAPRIRFCGDRFRKC